MIKCNAYSAEFKTDRTCVNNQHKLAEIKKQKRRKCYGISEILQTSMQPEYFRINKCDGCKAGIKLYKKAKSEGRLLVEHKIKWSIRDKARMALVDYHTRECQFRC